MQLDLYPGRIHACIAYSILHQPIALHRASSLSLPAWALQMRERCLCESNYPTIHAPVHAPSHPCELESCTERAWKRFLLLDKV